MLATVEAEQRQRLKYLQLDLSSLNACADAAKHFELVEDRCDVIIANAALSIMVSSNMESF